MSQATASKVTSGHVETPLRGPATAFTAPASGVVVAFAAPTEPVERHSLGSQVGCTVLDIREAPPSTDIVLTPILSPGAVTILRGMFPTARIVAYERLDQGRGYGIPRPAARALAAGIDDYCVVRSRADLSEALIGTIKALERPFGRSSSTPSSHRRAPQRRPNPVKPHWGWAASYGI